MEAFAPSSAERSSVAVLRVYQLMRHLFALRRPSYLLQLMITLFKLQVFEMVPRTARKSSRFSMITLILGLKHGDVIPTCENLSNLFGYFKAMDTCHAKLRYFDWDGQVHLDKGKTGGQQGDPLEMLIFNLTIHHV